MPIGGKDAFLSKVTFRRESKWYSKTKQELKELKNMATIEERAKKYSLKDFDGYYTGREKALEEGYIAGATEQKVIDDAEHINQVLMENGIINIYKQGYHDAVEKACKWLKKELRKLAMDELKDNFLENEFKFILKSQVPTWLINLRKAMEE